MASHFAQETDPAVLDRARRGDMDAHAALYRQFAAPVYTLALRMLGRRESAEEVVQDTFVELIRSLGQFRGEAPFWGWLRRLAVSKALMRLRADRSGPPVEPPRGDRGALDWPDPDAAAATERAVRCAEIERALAQLPPASRAVVWLHDVEGWTHAEIAAAMERTVSFSKSQLARAHARLRALLEVKTCERASKAG